LHTRFSSPPKHTRTAHTYSAYTRALAPSAPPHRQQALEEVQPLPERDADERWGLDEPAYDPAYTRCYPVLVVAPTSVLDNWEREFAMWGTFRWVGWGHESLPCGERSGGSAVGVGTVPNGRRRRGGASRMLPPNK
jgi:hypothetical protein